MKKKILISIIIIINILLLAIAGVIWYFVKTENNIVPGILVIYFDDNYPLKDAENFIKQNNLQMFSFDNITDSDEAEIYNLHYGLYALKPSFMVSPAGVFSIQQCEQEVKKLQSKMKGTDLEFSIDGASLHDMNPKFNLFFKEQDFQKIKEIFRDYDCLFRLDWKLNGIQDANVDGKKVKRAEISASYIVNKIDISFLKNLEKEEIVEKCEDVFEYGYVQCDCERGTLKKDIENLASRFSEAKIVEISISNSVRIKVPRGREMIWKRIIQYKLGKNGLVDYDYKTQPL